LRKLPELDPFANPPETIAGYAPLDYYGGSVRSLLTKFSVALEGAEDEAPLQKYFEANPLALVSLIGTPHTVWVLPRISLSKTLGGGFEPDFLICEWNSEGAEWSIVELESPTAKPINTRGFSRECRAAQRQIRDYRRFMKKNAQRLSGAGLPCCDQVDRSWILIGRTAKYNPEDRERLIDLRTDDIEVASYDRVFANCSRMVEMRTRQRQQDRKFFAKIKSRSK
jgi:Domain of unknown function (DUF4263)